MLEIAEAEEEVEAADEVEDEEETEENLPPEDLDLEPPDDRSVLPDSLV